LKPFSSLLSCYFITIQLLGIYMLYLCRFRHSLLSDVGICVTGSWELGQ